MKEERMKQIAEHLMDFIAMRFDYDTLEMVLRPLHMTEDEMRSFGYGGDEERSQASA